MWKMATEYNLTTREELYRYPLSHWIFAHTGQGYYSIQNVYQL